MNYTVIFKSGVVIELDINDGKAFVLQSIQGMQENPGAANQIMVQEDMFLCSSDVSLVIQSNNVKLISPKQSKPKAPWKK